MMKIKRVTFAEFRRFLKDLNFVEKRTEAAWIFHHASEGMMVFRHYGEDEPVDLGDLVSTRKFLDWRGLLEENEFDSFWKQEITPA